MITRYYLRKWSSFCGHLWIFLGLSFLKTKWRHHEVAKCKSLLFQVMNAVQLSVVHISVSALFTLVYNMFQLYRIKYYGAENQKCVVHIFEHHIVDWDHPARYRHVIQKHQVSRQHLGPPEATWATSMYSGPFRRMSWPVCRKCNPGREYSHQDKCSQMKKKIK